VLGFRVLDGRVPDEYALWLSIWDMSIQQDPHAHPDYVELWTRSSDRPTCAVYVDSQGGILLPFVIRPLEVEPWVAEADGMLDIVSPYGYGGPYSWGNADSSKFWREFDNWAVRNGVVSFFMRFSLFQSLEDEFSGTVEAISPNIVRCLGKSLDEIWMDYKHKVRKNVNKACRMGVKIELDFEGSRKDEFTNLYEITMDRRNASDFYYFGSSFFTSIFTKLKGNFAIFHALYDEKIVSTELVLLSRKYIYSFLGGTDPRYFSVRPNDLLKHAIVKWGVENGMEAYILGGGPEGKDGIFKYKESFAPNGEVPFRVGKCIYNDEMYRYLVDCRRKWENSNERNWIPSPEFFPEYRA